MKLLVTGGLGFIGSNFILKLLRKSDDFEIVNVDAELYGADKRNLSEIQNNKKYEFVKGNITNKRFMEEIISKCDLVVNFAAESFVDRSISDANPFLVSNIRGAFTILDIITKQKKRISDKFLLMKYLEVYHLVRLRKNQNLIHLVHMLQLRQPLSF